jgi:putative acyl-CoA dehydrogenase
MKDVLEYGNEVENYRPQLVQYDAWGNRIDEIVVCNGWNQLKKVSAEEGLIAIAYERKFKEFSRIYQFTKLYLFGPSSSIYTCPLAMTDGAARLLELHGNDKQKAGPYRHLTSRDPSEFWTSGQWMTEKTGGSDVGNSETVAVAKGDGHLITGYKFFTSASTSEMTLLLARAADDSGKTIPGSKGLSTFYLEMRRPDGKLNNLTVQKLKNKVGTKGLPTAEIELKDSVGYLVGTKHQGIKVISTILNITRIHNAVSCVSTMRRALAVATNYATKRKVFGKLLAEQPLHVQTLADVQLEFKSAFYFVFHTIHLLGKIENNTATKEQEILFRLLTPLLKLYTAKQAVAMVSECIEALGGTGYMEDEPYSLAKLWRDVQVCAIWEGTTNVLSLDVWRPLKSEGAFDIYVQDVKGRLNAAQLPQLKDVNAIVFKGIHYFVTSNSNMC